MAFSSNPKFVTDGLGLALDANDVNSARLLREVEVMVVGGGGGGGMDMGGGGGGGGVVYQPSYKVSPGQIISVTVGAGGYGAPAGGGYRTDGAGPQPGSHQFTIRATNGGNSAFGPLVALGGGYGGSSYYGYTPDYGIGGTGASGGGNSGYTAGATTTAPLGTVGQGNRGGNAGGGSYYSGGGGGAGTPGIDGPNPAHGGDGVQISRMSPYWFGGGGGGSSYSGDKGGNGGKGGGGGAAARYGTQGYGDTNGINAGANGGLGDNQPGGNGGANTGGGGGGGSHYNSNNKGGEGGSGIVIVRYNGPQAASGGTYSFSNGVSYHTFTSNGEFVPYLTGTRTIFDSSGNNLNASGAYVTTAAGGRNQYGFRSNGNDVDTPSTSLLNTDYHSIFMIIRFISTESYPNGTIGNWEQFFGFYGGGSDRTPGVWRYPNNRIIHWRYDPGNSGCDFLDYYGTGGDFALNRDYFIGVTKNGSTGTPYVDGVAVPPYSGGTVSNPKTAGNSVIRMFDYYTSELMEIKGLWVYNRALSAAEVAQNYNAIRTRLIK